MNFTPQTGFVMFRIVIPTLIFLIQIFLYTKARRWLLETYPEKKILRYLVTGIFLCYNAALAYVAIQRPRLLDTPDWFIYFGAYPFYVWHGATLFVGLILLISWVIKLPFRTILGVSRLIPPARTKLAQWESKESFQQFNNSRRMFLRRGVYGLTAVSFSGTAYGVFLEKHSHEVNDVEFPIRNLHPALDGFTISLISDIHSSVFMTKKDMDRYVDLVNEMGSDMVVVPGDFVNGNLEEVYPFAEAFSNLRARYGAFGVMGNHDYYNSNPVLVAKEVDACGVKLLRNDRTVIEKGGGTFYLLGIDDVGRPQQAEAAMDVSIGQGTLDIPRILLCHRPYFLPQASARNIDLVLSGHTHGGQIVLAQFGDVVIAPASLASRYVWGKYNYGNTQMYISRGIGTVGLPIRINCPPEITKIRLRTA